MHTASGPGSGGVHLVNPCQKRVQHLEYVMPVTSPYFVPTDQAADQTGALDRIVEAPPNATLQM